jgi:hypothetical protein
MAAKNKRSSIPGGAAVIARSSSGLLFRAAQHRDDLLDEVRTLQAAGRVRQARALQKRAEQIGQLVGALETEVGAHDAVAAPETPS